MTLTAATHDGPPPLLTANNVTKRFGATIALDGVNLHAHPGSIHALIGENGAGKSTLMKILSGAHPPDAGSITFNNQPYIPRNPLAARRAGVAMIYQELALAPHLTVTENILLGMERTTLGFINRQQQHQIATDALQQLGHRNINPNTPTAQLSIAQQQIVEIARAIAVGCKLLILDEPTSSLNQPDILRLFALLKRLKQTNLAIIYISHFLEEVMSVADRFTVLRDGQTVATGPIAQSSPQQLAAHMVGRPMTDLYDRHPHTPSDTLLTINNLTGKTKPNNASIEVRRGEVVGIAGLVGAGRTELLRAVFGLDTVTSGTIKIAHNLGHASPTKRWKQSVGYVSEDRKSEGLALNLSIADNATLSHLNFGPPALLSPAKQRRAAQQLIQQLDIRCQSPDQPVASLSGGNQQKVALARLLHHHADLFLLDEPTRGIDIASKAQIYKLIDQLVQPQPESEQQPRAVLIVSSYLPELLGICDRIAVMHRGKLSPARPTQDWDEHKLVLAATGQPLEPV